MTKPVVIAGGGVAALECLMALRDVAGPELPITLIAPDAAFEYRPLRVAEPFSLGHARSYPLRDITHDFQATFVHDAVVEIQPDRRQVVCGDGATLEYEALVLALGARAEPAFAHAITFGEDGAHAALHGLRADLEQG